MKTIEKSVLFQVRVQKRLWSPKLAHGMSASLSFWIDFQRNSCCRKTVWIPVFLVKGIIGERFGKFGVARFLDFGSGE